MTKDTPERYELYSTRQKKLRGEVPDVYIYDEIPRPLRVQIINVLDFALGDQTDYRNTRGKDDLSPYAVYKFIVEWLCDDYGESTLPGTEPPYHSAARYPTRDYFTELRQFLTREPDAEKVLDAVELAFRCIDRYSRQAGYRHLHDAAERADGAIATLNRRFRENGVGFRFETGHIIRIDSEFMHEKATKAALALLQGKEFAGPQDEFLKAHEHHRHGRNKEAMAECLKALESTMKAICDKRGWQYKKDSDTAKQLIDICLANGLIPKFWQTHFASLRSMLESSVPTGRNKMGGHGQGATPKTVPNHIVAYMLHMAASTIVFLVEAERALAP